jgi:hypothetical protein
MTVRTVLSFGGALNPQVKTVDRPFTTRRFRKCLRHVMIQLVAIIIPGLGIESIQDMEARRDGVTLLLELINVSTGLHAMPIVYSNSTPRHTNCHRSWGMTWGVKEYGGMEELY